MQDYKTKIQAWVLRQTDGKPATIWLSVISFLESSVFPVPPDFFLLPATVKQPSLWRRYALVVTVSSVLGAMLGYLIGYGFFSAFGEKIVGIYHLEDEMAYVGNLFDKNAFWAMFTAAFTPIPFKIFTIAGGLFRINFLQFIVASILGRGLRFFAVSYISKVFGEKMGYAVFKNFNLLTLLFAVVVVVFGLFQIFG